MGGARPRAEAKLVPTMWQGLWCNVRFYPVQHRSLQRPQPPLPFKTCKSGMSVKQFLALVQCLGGCIYLPEDSVSHLKGLGTSLLSLYA